jgi:hypothetical protein
MKSPATTDASQARKDARALYPLYLSLGSEFVIDTQPCPELESETEFPSAEALAKAETWFDAMDARIQAHQLRQFLQTSQDMTDEMLRGLLRHHINRKLRTDHDRDKVDFLLVQFLSQQVPSKFSDADLSMPAVAKLLEPILGGIDMGEPEWLASLNDLIGSAEHADSLKTLFTSRTIERGREIKISAGEKFFEPIALAAFARFGVLIRRKFFHLMHQDLNAILDGLRELESRGVTMLDCRKAQFAADEPILRLQMICQSWKVMFHAEYSSGQALCILADLRTAVEAGLAKSASPAKQDSAHGRSAGQT